MTSKLWSINALSLAFGMDRRTVGKCLEGIPPAGQEAGSPVWALRDVASVGPAAKASQADAATLTAERARLTREQADAVELRNGVSRGEYVAVAEVEATWTGAILEMRSALLSITSRVRQQIPAMTAAEAAIIDDELRRAMTAISKGGAVQ